MRGFEFDSAVKDCARLIGFIERLGWACALEDLKNLRERLDDAARAFKEQGSVQA
jgi:hypothetical protein